MFWPMSDYERVNSRRPEVLPPQQCPHCSEWLQYVPEGKNYPCERCGILWRICERIEVIDGEH